MPLAAPIADSRPSFCLRRALLLSATISTLSLSNAMPATAQSIEESEDPAQSEVVNTARGDRLPAATAADGSTLLDTITVQGGGAGQTEGRDDYRADDASVASRIPTSIRETPQSVSVITRDRMDDQLFTSDSEAIANTVGMRVSGPAWNETITSRGFESLNNVDGLKMNSEGNPYQSPTDAFLFDSIEILRGPAGLLEGAGSPGGVVNRVLKRPRDAFGALGGVTYGSFDLKRIEADIYGPLTPDGSVRGRLVGVAHDRGFFQDVSGQERKAILGSIEADVTDATSVSISGFYQKDDNNAPFWGLPTYGDSRLLDVPRSTYLGADWGRYDTEYGVVTGKIEHRLDNGWKARIVGNYFDFQQDERDLFVSGAVTDTNGGILYGSPYRDLGSAKGYNLDASLDGDFSLFGKEHRFVVGANYMHSDYGLSQGYANGSTPIDVFNPNPQGIPEPDDFIMYVDQTRTYTQYGIYGQVNFKLADPLTLVAGGRLNWATYDSFNNISSTLTPGYDQAFFTPLLGLVYDLTPTTTLYANYADIFKPQTATDYDGNLLPPITGTQYEAGIRQQLFDGRLMVSAAAFHILRENEAFSQRAPDGRRYSIAAGETRSRGIELEAVGKITDSWKLYAGYAYTDARILKATSYEDNVIANTPRHKFNLWTSYGFHDGALEGLEVGGGVTVSSEFYDITNAIKAPAFITVDLGASYKVNENFALSLKIGNVFDKKYYRSVGSLDQGNYYGDPRSITFQAKALF